MSVLATVVSRPTDGRAILDAGSKTLSSDTLGLDGFGLITEYPQLVLAKFSEEHGHVDCSASNARPRIGERVTIIPNHACAVTNLHDGSTACATAGWSGCSKWRPAGGSSSAVPPGADSPLHC